LTLDLDKETGSGVVAKRAIIFYYYLWLFFKKITQMAMLLRELHHPDEGGDGKKMNAEK
jgi:hypothetical protein